MARLKDWRADFRASGTNLQALLDACADEDFPAEIVSVIANKAGAQGLERARKAGVKARFIDHTLYEEREDFERELDGKLQRRRRGVHRAGRFHAHLDRPGSSINGATG
jgi:folate-dependent phosphoribosylglycinamide formyltransferase PurN